MYNMKMKIRHYTLIELLVVVAITGVLCGILMPAVMKAKEKAKQSYCQNSLKGIGTAFGCYLNDFKGIMPVAAAKPTTNADYARINDMLADYIPAVNKSWACLADVITYSPATKKTYWEQEGLSYEYVMALGGAALAGGREPLTKRFVMFDFEPFHGKSGKAGSCNYLFADWHVGDIE